MDDRRSTIGAKRAVAFDIEQQQQQEDPASVSTQVINKQVSNTTTDDQGGSSDQGQEGEGESDNVFNEEFDDPYLGLGVRDRPDLSVLLVFNLMESRRFTSFSSPLREKLLYLDAVVGGALLAAAVLLCLALFGFQVRERPQLPIVTVKTVAYAMSGLDRVQPQVIVQQQQENKGNYYAYTFSFRCEVAMDISNPNRHSDIYHHSVEVTTLYQGVPLAVDRLDDIPHPRRDTIHPFFLTYAIGVPLPLQVGYTLEREFFRGTGPTRLVLEIIFHSRISLLKGFKGLAYAWRCRCKIVNAFRCQCLDAKWQPSHHLKLLRDSTWPRDYRDVVLNNYYYNYYYDYYANTTEFMNESFRRLSINL